MRIAMILLLLGNVSAEAGTVCRDKGSTNKALTILFISDTETRLKPDPSASFLEQVEKDDVHRSSQDYCITAFQDEKGMKWIAYRRDRGAADTRYVPATAAVVRVGGQKVDLNFSTGTPNELTKDSNAEK